MASILIGFTSMSLALATLAYMRGDMEAARVGSLLGIVGALLLVALHVLQWRKRRQAKYEALPSHTQKPFDDLARAFDKEPRDVYAIWQRVLREGDDDSEQADDSNAGG